jgi:hypothetical protein
LRNIRLTVLILLTLAFAATGGEAFANVCRSIQAELAAIGRGPSSAERQNHSRSAAEAQRIYAHMRTIGCDRSGIFAFGAPPPPECPALRARMNQLQQSYAASAGGENRRRALNAMLDTHNCRQAPAPRSQPLTAGLFDDGSRRSTIEIRPDEDIDPPPRIESRIRTVGGRNVCVRSCDGFFFPVQVRPGTAAEDGDQICQSLCPAAEAKLYTMRTREIDEAVSMAGDAYADLPTAFLYRKRYNPACFCRQPGESFSDRATRVLNSGDGSGQPFDTLNPEAGPPPEDPPLRGLGEGRTRRDASVFGNRPPPAPPAPPHPPEETPAERTVKADQGEVTEFQAKDGSRRTVRIIAPELSRGPSEAKAPSIPDRAPTP